MSRFIRFSPVVLAAAAALIAVPVSAQDAPPAVDTEAEMGEMVEKLNDPALQEGVGAMAEAMGEALLSMKVGSLMKAMEQARPGSAPSDIDEDATLADMAGPAARDMPRELGRQAPVMMSMMAGMAEGMAAMLPQFRDLAERMGRTMERAQERSNRRSR